MQVTTHVPGLFTPYEFESVTVGTSAVGLTTSKWRQRGSEANRDMGNARVVFITVEGRIRYRIDGLADPTGLVGHVLDNGDTLTLASIEQFTKFRAIRENGEVADATLRVTYMR